MRRMLIAAACLMAPVLGAGSADAAKFEFRGDQGTRCVVEVGAAASHGIQVLQAPRVGFSADPVCTYAPAADGAGAKADAKAEKRARKCKKAKGKAKKRACRKKGGKKRGSGRAYAAPAVQPAILRQAQLFLLGAGATLPGEQTLATLGVGGYTCSVLPAVSTCADQGSLSPATPQAPYQARYEVTVVPPPGERWVTIPAGCSVAAAPVCTMFSPSVVPMVL